MSAARRPACREPRAAGRPQRGQPDLRRLDEQVEAFPSRPLEGRYLFLFLDAEVEKVRDGGRVQRKCVVVAHGVHETGRREIIGLDVGAAEIEAFWTDFLRALVARGPIGVQLIISDVHQGLKNAIAKVLGAPWQRTSAINRSFGVLTQWGLRRNLTALRKPDAIDELAAHGVPAVWLVSITTLLAVIDDLDRQLGVLERELRPVARADTHSLCGGARLHQVLRHAFVHGGRAFMGPCEALNGLRSAACHGSIICS